MNSFTFNLRVYHEDVDCFGVVYHPNFLKYMERARLEWALAEGYDFHRWESEGIIFAIRSAKLDYLRPVRIYNDLQVVSRIIEAKRVSLVYEQIIRLANDPDKICCIGQIKIACIDNNYRPRAIPNGFTFII